MRISRRAFMAASGAAGLSGFLTPPVTFALAADGYLEITAGPSLQKLYADDAPASTLWTYNGSAPGPEIKAKVGERIKVRLINKLEEPTSIHWHGIRIDNDMDGVSGLTQNAVPPGETFDYEFTCPDAGTYWYHAHNKSWNQVARGLYGPLIIEEETPVFDIAHDITLMLDDWRLDDQGVLETASMGAMMDWSHAGRLGNWLTVNGRSLPDYELTAGEAYRVRLVNASNARILELDVAGLGAKLLAYDGQAFEAPTDAPDGALLIGPAQRVDLLIVPEEAQDLGIREISGADPYEFARFKVNAGRTLSAKLPNLPVNHQLAEPDLGSARKLTLDMTGGAMGQMGGLIYKGEPLTRDVMRETGQLWGFNGVANMPEAPFFSVEAGETILLEVLNNTAFAHAMHTHGHHFRIVSQSRKLVDDTGSWRDTFLIAPGEKASIAFVADNPGKWLLHCHMLEHAAAGMMTWFEVATRS